MQLKILQQTEAQIGRTGGEHLRLHARVPVAGKVEDAGLDLQVASIDRHRALRPVRPVGAQLSQLTGRHRVEEIVLRLVALQLSQGREWEQQGEVDEYSR